MLSDWNVSGEVSKQKHNRKKSRKIKNERKKRKQQIIPPRSSENENEKQKMRNTIESIRYWRQ